MEDIDAELIERIYAQSPQVIKQIIDATFYLHIDSLQRRLTAGLIAGLNN
jgi:hypothetical protein